MHGRMARHAQQHTRNTAQDKTGWYWAVVTSGTRGTACVTPMYERVTWHSPQVRALDQLKVARGVLSNSYAFAYFFFGGEQGMLGLA